MADIANLQAFKRSKDADLLLGLPEPRLSSTPRVTPLPARGAQGQLPFSKGGGVEEFIPPGAQGTGCDEGTHHDKPRDLW